MNMEMILIPPERRGRRGAAYLMSEGMRSSIGILVDGSGSRYL